MPNNEVKTQAMIDREDFLGDRLADALTYSKMPSLHESVATWWRHSDPTNPQMIVMVDMDETFICYASDARKLARATGLPLVELNDIPLVSISILMIDEYIESLATKGIKLVRI